MDDYIEWKIRHKLIQDETLMHAIVYREQIGDLYIKMNIDPDVTKKFMLNKKIIDLTDKLISKYIDYQELTLIKWCNKTNKPIKEKTYEHIKRASTDIDNIQMYKKDRLLYHNMKCANNTLKDFTDVNGDCMCIRNRRRILHTNGIYSKQLHHWSNTSNENYPAFLLDWD